MLIPAAADFTMRSLTPPPSGRVTEPVEVRPGVFRLGGPGIPDLRLLVGHCAFGANDAALLVSLLPELVVVRGEQRLTTLVELLSDEARADRPGRKVVLGRLLEVLLIEAFRATTRPTAAPGLLRGLADERLAAALRLMHGEPARPWTVGELAREAALSRSTFFERFRREVGVSPIEYLSGWRMAIAKDLCAVKASAWARSRNVWATARRARSASHLRARSALRRRRTLAGVRAPLWPAQLQLGHEVTGETNKRTTLPRACPPQSKP